MYDNFDNSSDEISYSSDFYDASNCLECPYFTRQFPSQPPFIGNPQGGPQGRPPFTGGSQGRPPFTGGPPGPPPSIAPAKAQQQPGVQFVSPGSIRPCTYRFVYIWLNNGRSFWAWLTRVDRRSVSGWRWNGRRWVYFGVDLRSIDYFECF